jgi:hypothetical protein
MPDSLPTAGRPFPWFCPRCRRQEVRRATVPYQCQRLDHGQPVTVTLPELAVPRCEYCGELVFDYEAEEQINRACDQLLASKNGGMISKDVPATSDP